MLSKLVINANKKEYYYIIFSEESMYQEKSNTDYS